MPDADTDPLDALNGIAVASASAIENLKAEVPEQRFAEAVRMIGAAREVCVVGRRQARAIAGCLGDGLTQSGFRCRLLHTLSQTEQGYVSTLHRNDLLVAITLEQGPCPVADVIPLAVERRVPILGITNSPANPVAKEADLNLLLGTMPGHGVRPLAPYFVLVQALIVTLNDDRLFHGTGLSRD